ncbi:MAG: DUF1385 domain-containing protein [Chitinispirillaceae bacterium]|nr:DUF1385 domain-containing protein [Chitinispirillaceae bacterium]
MRRIFLQIFSAPVLWLLAQKKRKVGGQAIIEGVMMRGKDNVSWAVRRSDTDIVVERNEFISAAKKVALLKKPVFRGAVGLFESIVLGYRALTRSAEIFEDEQRKQAQEQGKELKERNKKGEKILTGLSLVVSLVFAFGIFMFIPMWVLSKFVPRESALLFNTLSGSLRIIFFLIYLIAISFWKEIRRVFEYHGAEHMAIFAYEAGKDLTIENMRNYTTLHPRCGTSFLLLVGIVCILLFSIVDALVIGFIGPYPTVLARFAVHLLLVPLISGTSYEILKLSDAHQNLPVVGWLIQPGLMLQKITTKTPDDSQLEVAAKALQAAL